MINFTTGYLGPHHKANKIYDLPIFADRAPSNLSLYKNSSFDQVLLKKYNNLIRKGHNQG